MSQTVKIVCYDFKYRKKISNSKKFVPQKISEVKFSDITSVRK